jgi:NhaP-type Na+/H+ or K+/H+ antiporter
MDGQRDRLYQLVQGDGVIPAAVASLLLARGVEGAEIAVSMVALAVCVTLLLQATTGQATSPAVSAC